MPAPTAPISDQPLQEAPGTLGLEERMLAYNTGFETPPVEKKPAAPAAPEAAAPTPEPEPAAEAAPAPPEEEPAEAQPEDVPPAPQLHTVIVDGKEAQVPVDELIAGYQRQADYTRKTQDLARDRTVVETEMRSLRETREKEAQVLTAAEQWLSTQMPTETPDWERAAKEMSDADFNRAYAAYNQQKEKLVSVQTKLASIRETQQREAGEQYRQYVLAQEQKLAERVPEWKDTAKARTEMTALAKYMKERFPETTDAEIASTVDHRMWALLRDAKAYRDALGKPKVSRPASATPVAAPGARGVPPKKPDVVVEAREHLRETGHIEDATEAVFRMLETGVLK